MNTPPELPAVYAVAHVVLDSLIGLLNPTKPLTAADHLDTLRATVGRALTHLSDHRHHVTAARTGNTYSALGGERDSVVQTVLVAGRTALQWADGLDGEALAARLKNWAGFRPELADPKLAKKLRADLDTEQALLDGRPGEVPTALVATVQVDGAEVRKPTLEELLAVRAREPKRKKLPGKVGDGMPSEEANQKADELHQKYGADFLNLPQRQWAKLIGCGVTQVGDLDLWKKYRAGGKKVAAPRTVASTAVGSQDATRTTRADDEYANDPTFKAVLENEKAEEVTRRLTAAERRERTAEIVRSEQDRLGGNKVRKKA